MFYPTRFNQYSQTFALSFTHTPKTNRRPQIEPSRVHVQRPYETNLPYQSLSFINTLFKSVFKKKLLLMVCRQRLSANSLQNVNAHKFPPQQQKQLSRLWLFTHLHASFLSLTPTKSILGCFFLLFSKKELNRVQDLFRHWESISRLSNGKGFFFLEKGKIAWKALSRKQKITWSKGKYAKSNYNLAVSESRFSYPSNTGVVHFSSSLFFYYVLFI